jgi:hypothetical protein
MLRHVRIVVFLAIVAAVAIGLLLPNPWNRDKEVAQVSQVPTLSID